VSANPAGPPGGWAAISLEYGRNQLIEIEDKNSQNLRNINSGGKILMLISSNGCKSKPSERYACSQRSPLGAVMPCLYGL
jgi:hypothetical protein